eukprot:Seg1762.6 transcript_id=Seg1762.6/GoldUCD/mRNA.D3Y31 product="hypothetical protein" protein_id=Seg1762.6/GoldUCD/D3Y31
MSVIAHTESKPAERTPEIKDNLKNSENIVGLKKNPIDRRKYTHNAKRMNFIVGLDKGYRFPYGYSSAFPYITDPVYSRLYDSWMFKGY